MNFNHLCFVCYHLCNVQNIGGLLRMLNLCIFAINTTTKHKIMKHLLLLLTALVCFLTASARRDPRYHYEGANSGTYGLSNKRIQCSNCGEFYSAGSQHMCLKHDAGGSSSSSSYPTDGSDVSDGEADALLAANPDLLINQTGIRNPAPNEEEAESASDDDDDNTDAWIGGAIVVVGIIIWLKSKF